MSSLLKKAIDPNILPVKPVCNTYRLQVNLFGKKLFFCNNKSYLTFKQHDEFVIYRFAIVGSAHADAHP